MPAATPPSQHLLQVAVSDLARDYIWNLGIWLETAEFEPSLQDDKIIYYCVDEEIRAVIAPLLTELNFNVMV